MGIGMALNLQKHLASKGMPPLRYSNRTISRGEPLKEAGAIPEETFEAVVSKSNIIFTMVCCLFFYGFKRLKSRQEWDSQLNAAPIQISNDEVLDDLVSKALEAGITLEGKVWIDTSTVHPNTCARCSERLGERGATFVASPVFGASPMAAAGKLIFSMAGPAATIERLGPFILSAMGRSIINMGEDVRKASLLKISGYVFNPNSQVSQVACTRLGSNQAADKSSHGAETSSSSASRSLSPRRTSSPRRQASAPPRWRSSSAACTAPCWRATRSA